MLLDYYANVAVRPKVALAVFISLSMAIMNKTIKTAALFLLTFLVFNNAQAASDAATEPTKNTSSGSGTSVKEVIKHDAKATGHAVKRAAKATARVVKRGAKAVANGVKRGTKAITKSSKHEDNATSNTSSRQGN